MDVQSYMNGEWKGDDIVTYFKSIHLEGSAKILK
jgi:hypothetical protein